MTTQFISLGNYDTMIAVRSELVTQAKAKLLALGESEKFVSKYLNHGELTASCNKKSHPGCFSWRLVMRNKTVGRHNLRLRAKYPNLGTTSDEINEIIFGNVIFGIWGVKL